MERVPAAPAPRLPPEVAGLARRLAGLASLAVNNRFELAACGFPSLLMLPPLDDPLLLPHHVPDL